MKLKGSSNIVVFFLTNESLVHSLSFSLLFNSINQMMHVFGLFLIINGLLTI